MLGILYYWRVNPIQIHTGDVEVWNRKWCHIYSAPGTYTHLRRRQRYTGWRTERGTKRSCLIPAIMWLWCDFSPVVSTFSKFLYAKKSANKILLHDQTVITFSTSYAYQMPFATLRLWLFTAFSGLFGILLIPDLRMNHGMNLLAVSICCKSRLVVIWGQSISCSFTPATRAGVLVLNFGPLWPLWWLSTLSISLPLRNFSSMC